MPAGKVEGSVSRLRVRGVDKLLVGSEEQQLSAETTSQYIRT